MAASTRWIDANREQLRARAAVLQTKAECNKDDARICCSPAFSSGGHARCSYALAT
jgi:hypothetical protein